MVGYKWQRNTMKEHVLNYCTPSITVTAFLKALKMQKRCPLGSENLNRTKMAQ